MVFEFLVSPFQAEKRPGALFFIGIFYASLALMLSIWVFKEYAGMLSIFLIVLASLPLVLAATRMEEEKDVIFTEEKTLLKEHSKTILFFLMLFLGVTIAYALWFTFLPANAAASIFSAQINTLTVINVDVNAPLGFSVSRIFFNNVKVLTFSLLFSLFYGVGAFFIFGWNASVIGSAMGIFIKRKLEQYLNLFGVQYAAVYFHSFSLSVLRYAIHGIPEILAYIIAGLAGGILSFAVIRNDFRTKRFERILTDVSQLLLLSLAILFIAAILEVYVTPLFF